MRVWWSLVTVLVVLAVGCVPPAADTDATTIAPTPPSSTGATSTSPPPPATTSTAAAATTPPTTTTTVAGPPLLEIFDPVHGATVTSRDYEFRGRTDPGCTVDVGGRYFADVAVDGSWTLDLLLGPGTNTTTVTARDPETRLATSRAVQVGYDPPLMLRPDGLGELDFATPEDEAVAYLLDILGPPSADETRSFDGRKPSYERVMSWTLAGLEVVVSDDGGWAPGGHSLWLEPTGLTGWRVVATGHGPRFETQEGIGVGTSALAACTAYGADCDSDSPSVEFSGEYWDWSVPNLALSFDGPGTDPSAVVVQLASSYTGDLVYDYEAAIERLQFRARLLGTWRGTITTPSTPPYAIELRISQDRYEAVNLVDVATPPLYFGVAECAGPSGNGRCDAWNLSGAQNGTGEGWVMVPTEADTEAVGLENIQLSADDSILDIDLWWTIFDPRDSIHFEGTRIASP